MTKTKQEFIDDRFYYTQSDMVEVNALDFIALLILEEQQARAIKILQDKLNALEVALDCAKYHKHTINLRC